MRRTIVIFLLAACGIAMIKPDWGFFGHRQINKHAVFTLPPTLMKFFKKHIAYVSEHAVDPDKRRYATKFEAIRHYIDLDHWGELPFDNVPRDFHLAILEFSDIHLINDFNDTIKLSYQERLEDDLYYFWQDSINGLIRAQKGPLIAYYKDLVRYNYYEDDWKDDTKDTPVEGARIGDYQNIEIIDNFSPYGINPYYLYQHYFKLQRAFENKDVKLILQLSADMGHYLGDAHVPLHTTENYNGAMTDQIGIHAFWESRIPELMALEEFDFFVGKAEYVDDPKNYFWEVVLESHSYLDSVLLIEKRLRNELRDDQIYCYEERLNRVVRTECEKFARTYASEMDGMVERRWRESIRSIGSIWYTAWVNAGQPDLDEDVVEDDAFAKESEILEEKYKKGKAYGRPH